jgi:hypothetical protein
VSEHLDTEMARRRELLKRAAWLLGGAISTPAALAILQGCSAREPGSAPAKPGFLTEAQYLIVAEIAEIMIPKTDTAGARDAGVPEFIDTVLAAVYSPQQQQHFRDEYESFAQAMHLLGTPFLKRSQADRVDLVRRSVEIEIGRQFDDDHKPFLLMVRELALLGYFTSRVGITENMEYVPVPTAYHGCVPLSQMKKHVYWE